MKNTRSVVAHVHDKFFFRSETFIYHYTTRHKRFHPIYAAAVFENLDRFPIPKQDRFKTRCARFTYPWVLEKFYGPDIHLERVIKKNKVRIMHAHFGMNGFGALGAASNMQIPLVTTFYGFDISKLARKEYWKTRYAILFQRGDLFLVEGEFMKSKLVELGCPERKIKVQRIAIPIDRIPYKPCLAKSSSERVIFVFSGRFVEKKGLLDALGAFEQLRRNYTNFEFRIIGDGPLKAQVEEFIIGRTMTDSVKLLGFLNYNDYLNEIASADIFVHPSVTAADGDSEGGAPTTILEAQARGMPVISTFHADIPNVVVPGKSALLCEERNVGQLAENLAWMLENRNNWIDMGAAGREFVKTYHDAEKEIDRLEDKYDSLL